MIVAVSLSLQDVFIAGECITIVHVPQLLHQVVHCLVVQSLLLVQQVCFLLDNVVETNTIGQLEGVFHFWLIEHNSLG